MDLKQTILTYTNKILPPEYENVQNGLEILRKIQKKFDLTNQISAIYTDSKLFGDHRNS